MPDDNINSIVIDNNKNKWIGSDNGLTKFDGLNWNVIKHNNSDIQFTDINNLKIDKLNQLWMLSNRYLFMFDGINLIKYDSINMGYNLKNIISFDIDENDIKWIIGTKNLYKFDDVSVTKYEIPNSQLTNFSLKTISIDNDGNKWIGTIRHGLYKFKNDQWTIYDKEISELSKCDINCIAFDKNNAKLLATSCGIIYFNDTLWKVFNKYNYDIKSDLFVTIMIDLDNNILAGSPFIGLIKYDGSIFSNFNDDNSGLQSNHVTSIASDGNGNIWVGTSDNYTGGIAVFHKNLNSIKQDNNILLSNHSLYPNPFVDNAIIKYDINDGISVKIEIHNSFGTKLTSLVNEFQDTGEHKAVFDGSNYPSGVYYYTIHIGERVESGKLVLVK